jgi:hypothetical protein
MTTNHELSAVVAILDTLSYHVCGMGRRRHVA